MSSSYIRCLSRAIPVNNWRSNCTDSSINASVYIKKNAGGFLVGVRAKDSSNFEFKRETVFDTLSQAATEYECLLETCFHAIPNNVASDWFVANGFSSFEK